MGAEQSNLGQTTAPAAAAVLAASNDNVKSISRDENPRYGYHVLRVDSNSPAAAAKLIPYFDYIVAVNGVDVVHDSPNIVAEMAKNHVDRPMKLVVYNSRQDNLRNASIIPSRSWPGKTLLGASIRYTMINDAPSRVWRVLDVSMNSPAHVAGLIPNKDWVIGSPDIAINKAEDFYQLMIQNTKRPVRLLVFNIDSDAVREVSVIPDFEWGGEGCLGCDIASGILHRIPFDEQITTAVNQAPPAVTMPVEAVENVNSSSDLVTETPLQAVPSSRPASIPPIPVIPADLISTADDDFDFNINQQTQ